MLTSFAVLGSLAAGIIGLLGIYLYLTFWRRGTLTPPLSGRSDQGEPQSAEPSTKPAQVPSEPIKPYTKPKILLIDLDPEACPALTEVGYAAVEGSFGRSYRVPAGENFCQVVGKARLPGLIEQE